MCPTALALAAALALPSVPLTPTRPPPAGLPPSYAGFVLLRQNKSVQDELKMTEEQTAVLEKTMVDLTEKMREILREARADREKLPLLIKEFQAESVKAAAPLLKPEQAARLGQIELQAGGLTPLQREDVQQELKLTDRQKEQLKEAYVLYQQELRKVRSELRGSPEELQTRLQVLQQKASEAYADSFDAEQRRRWKELTGAPFAGKLLQSARPLPLRE